MIRWIRKVKLFFNAPKVGEEYVGDPLFFVIGRPVERIMHGMVDKEGSAVCQAVPSDDAYVLTVESVSMPYYRCAAKVLVTTNNVVEWKNRIQSRRIQKNVFIEMIIDGIIRKK